MTVVYDGAQDDEVDGHLYMTVITIVIICCMCNGCVFVEEDAKFFSMHIALNTRVRVYRYISNGTIA